MSSRPPGGLTCMTVLQIGGALDAARLEEICHRAAALLTDEDKDLVCDVAAIERPDVVLVDALAHVQLIAKRRGRDMRIRGACDRLCELIEFLGLENVLLVEARREPE